MLTRIVDFATYFALTQTQRELAQRESTRVAAIAGRMMDVRDYEALAAIALRFEPKRIFEIGTYLGATSDFFLALLPQCEVVSIAYINPRHRFLGKRYNNSELTREKVGSMIDAVRLGRFTQLCGDSHALDAATFVRSHGCFDLVFIDGDHTHEGVRQDTALALSVRSADGIVCWHDANPKPAYLAVRRYLENDLELGAIATSDDYQGGVAAWSPVLERALQMNPSVAPLD